MGPGRRVPTTNTAQDPEESQNEVLQAQVSACTARISHLSFRLRATLDALDDIQNAHAAEVADMQQAYDSLAGRASRWKQMAAEVERERDAMRDAVELLITKVESHNDFSQWPHSRVRLTSFPDPAEPLPSTLVPSINSGQSSSHLLAALQVQLKSEQARSKEALSRVTSLELQLARRDAELEYCAVHHTLATSEDYKRRRFPWQDNALGRRGDGENSGSAEDQTSQGDAVRVLDAIAARNRVLEQEIHGLVSRIEEARSAVHDDRPTSPNIRSQDVHGAAAANSEPPLPPAPPPPRHSGVHSIRALHATPDVPVRPTVMQNVDDQIVTLSRMVEALRLERAEWQAKLDEQEGISLTMGREHSTHTAQEDSQSFAEESLSEPGYHHTGELPQVFWDPGASGSSADLTVQSPHRHSLPAHMEDGLTERLFSTQQRAASLLACSAALDLEVVQHTASRPNLSDRLRVVGNESDGEQSMDLETPLRSAMTLHTPPNNYTPITPPRDVHTPASSSIILDPSTIPLPPTPIIAALRTPPSRSLSQHSSLLNAQSSPGARRAYRGLRSNSRSPSPLDLRQGTHRARSNSAPPTANMDMERMEHELAQHRLNLMHGEEEARGLRDMLEQIRTRIEMGED